ncbi:hypothetical protein [Novosphingobium pituita]|uniref:Uncharacterized protein n=1 Tax=Novosphingobium pituita TaxID=3056842 RepID=A0ABQ6PB07_9SPHN|nr:hypothetical protein [Novosphingobium sp. IK01]GMM62436.1 hypothetical protein NUTIK01_32130 [Novosphingobium sp. IK01]
MTDDPSHVALAAILDSLTLMQGQLDRLAKSNARIEQSHAEILHRLDTIDAGQGGVTDLVPILETMLARMIDDRAIQRDGIERVAEVAALAHAAAIGNGAPLPVNVADDPLLERFSVNQPADMVTPDRALIAWRETVASAGTAELVMILARQYQPSPTDTPETRVLRYRLAAITRDELAQRGADLPPVPRRTDVEDQSAEARQRRAGELADLWRAGAGPALFAEAELAGAVDLFTQAQDSGEEGALPAKLAQLHWQIGDAIERGEVVSRIGGMRNVAVRAKDPVLGKSR